MNPKSSLLLSVLILLIVTVVVYLGFLIWKEILKGKEAAEEKALRLKRESDNQKRFYAAIDWIHLILKTLILMFSLIFILSGIILFLYQVVRLLLIDVWIDFSILELLKYLDVNNIPEIPSKDFIVIHNIFLSILNMPLSLVLFLCGCFGLFLCRIRIIDIEIDAPVK